MVNGKLADAVGQFFNGHRILIVLPVELGFGQRLWACLHFTAVGQLTLKLALTFRQLFKQRWSDGQAVTAGQFDDFTRVAEAGAHHYGAIAVLLVVFINSGNGDHARIFRRSKLFLVAVGLIPVQNAADERRNQVNARFGAGASLSKGEQQGQVTVDALFLQLRGGANAL